jgi:hypothetical protein
MDSRILDLGTSLEVSVQFHTLVVLSLEKDPGTHWIGRWVGPKIGLDVVETKISCLWSSSPQPFAIATEISGLLTCNNNNNNNTIS